MTNILDKILITKKEEIASSKLAKSIHDLENDIRNNNDKRAFIAAIEDKFIGKDIAIIAEVSHGLSLAGQPDSEHVSVDLSAVADLVASDRPVFVSRRHHVIDCLKTPI